MGALLYNLTRERRIYLERRAIVTVSVPHDVAMLAKAKADADGYQGLSELVAYLLRNHLGLEHPKPVETIKIVVAPPRRIRSWVKPLPKVRKRAVPLAEGECGMCGQKKLKRSQGEATFQTHRAPGCDRPCYGGEAPPTRAGMKNQEPWHMGRGCGACQATVTA